MDRYKTIFLVIITMAIVWYFIFYENNRGKIFALQKSKGGENFMSVDLLESNMNPVVLAIVSKMLKDFNGLFSAFGITYWIDGPTLLSGAIYNKIMPWNHDANICVLFEDKHKLLALVDRFNEMGYGFGKFWGGYRLWPLNGINPKYYNRRWFPWETNFDLADEEFFDYKYPYLNIFLCRREKDRGDDIYRYSNPTARRIFSNYFHRTQDLFPLKQYKLGDAIVLGPKNPYPYLDRNYDYDQITTGYQVRNFEKSRWDPMVKGKVVQDRDLYG